MKNQINRKTIKQILLIFTNQIKSFYLKICVICAIITIYGSDNISAQSTTDTERSRSARTIDSLKQVIKTAKHDTTRISAYYAWGDVYLYLIPDTAMIYYEKSKALAEKFLAFKLSSNVAYTAKKQLANALNNIGYIYSNQGDIPKAIEYYNKSLKIQEDIGDKNGLASCYYNIGIVHKEQGSYDNALEYYFKALKIKEEIQDKKGMASCYNGIGIVNLYKGSYDKALEYFLKSLKIDEKLGDKEGMSSSYNNIGFVHDDQGSYDKAIEYYLKALKIKKELGDKKGMSGCYNNIGSVYYSQCSYDNALEYFFKSLIIKAELLDKKGMSNCYNNIGNVHNSQGNYDKAIEYYLKALQIFEELGDKNGIAASYVNIASLNISLADSSTFNKKQYLQYLTKSIEYGTNAIVLAQEIKAIPMENGAANTLMNAYKKLGNFKKSIEYAEIFISTKDSMFSEEKTKSLAEMGAKYESEKRELTIQKLEKEQLLQTETIARKNAESKKQRILIFSFLAGFIIILVFSIFLYRLFIQKKLANVILSQQKEEISAQRDEIETQRDLVTVQKVHIEEIHKEVTDSINYAERIQRSFLATKELLDENLNEYFVLFHPKDVVSGDFYWAGKLQNGNFALATADSTGHGVPGAIMSILNISSIEKAVEQGICEPSEILNHTRKTIIERLKKDGSPEGGKDGMDTSLICFDYEPQKLTYSAANNPIWIVRQTLQHIIASTYQLIELEPDKMPVGKHDKDQISFTQHEFQLQKGDVIYTLTDGFQDQFGGLKGKKFLSKNLKQLLLDNCQLPMIEQKEILEKTLVEWIGDGEQIDDITLVGIRI